MQFLLAYTLFCLICSLVAVCAQVPCLNFIGDGNTVGVGLTNTDMAYPAVLHNQYGYEVFNTSSSTASIGDFWNFITNSRYTILTQRPSCDNWVMLGGNDLYANNNYSGSKNIVNFYYTNILAMSVYLAIDGHCVTTWTGSANATGWCGTRASANSSIPGNDYYIKTPGGYTDWYGYGYAGACMSGSKAATFMNIKSKYFIVSIFDQATVSGYTSSMRFNVSTNNNGTVRYILNAPIFEPSDNSSIASQLLYILDLGPGPDWDFNVEVSDIGASTLCIGYYQYYTPGDLSNVVKLVPPAFLYLATGLFTTYTYINQIYKDVSNYVAGFSIPIQYVPGLGSMDENAWQRTASNWLSCDGHAGVAYAVAKSYQPEALMPTSQCYTSLTGISEQPKEWAISSKSRNKLMHALNGNNPDAGLATQRAFKGRGRGKKRGGPKKERFIGPQTRKAAKRSGRRKVGRAKKRESKKGFIGPQRAPKIAKEVTKDAKVEDKVASSWIKIMKDPMNSGTAKLGDVSVPTTNGFLSARVLNYGYQPDVTVPFQLYLVTCSDAVANAEGVTGNQGLTIWGWRTSTSTAPEFMTTIGYENAEFLKSFTGASRPLGIRFTVRIQMPSTATPGEVYAGSIPTDGGFAELSAYINSLSCEQVQSLPDITRITGNAVAAPWRPLDDNNLKFTESNFQYDPTINPKLLPGGQYAVTVLSGWPWRVGNADPATAANFDIEAGSKYELLPVREAAALVPPTYEAPKTAHDLPAIWSKVVSKMGSVATMALKESASSAMDSAGGMLGGLFGMASSHGLRGSKLLAAYRKPRKSNSFTIYKNLGAPGFHPISGFSMEHGYSRYLHNTDPTVSEAHMVSIMPPAKSMSLAPNEDPVYKPKPLVVAEPPTPNGFVKVGFQPASLTQTLQKGMWG